MSVQTQIDRLNAVKERIRTNLVAQGITVPEDTMLEAMAEQILSVAGEDGQRGTGLLPVTTAPSGYTTAVGGITPKYRMAISTIKTQAGVTDVLLGDTVRYSYYHYPIAYLDASYAYATTRVSIRGATGAEGAAGADGNDYVLTEADKSEIAALVIEMLGGNPIFGIVDENNNIIVSGDLPDGTYSVKYEMENGNNVNIGNLVLDSNVYYTVTNNLTNCTSNNSATKAVQDGSYSATITAKSGHELKSVTVTMGGSPVTVSGGVINIANVTGNIVITAVAEAAGPAYTNQIPISTDASGNPFNGGQGWKTGYRLGSSTGEEKAQSGIEITGFIPCKYTDTLYFKGITITSASTETYCFYDENHAFISGGTTGGTFGTTNGSVISKAISTISDTKLIDGKDKVAFVRISANTITADSIITVSQAIE